MDLFRRGGSYELTGLERIRPAGLTRGADSDSDASSFDPDLEVQLEQVNRDIRLLGQARSGRYGDGESDGSSSEAGSPWASPNERGFRSPTRSVVSRVQDDDDSDNSDGGGGSGVGHGAQSPWCPRDTRRELQECRQRMALLEQENRMLRENLRRLSPGTPLPRALGSFDSRGSPGPRSAPPRIASPSQSNKRPRSAGHLSPSRAWRTPQARPKALWSPDRPRLVSRHQPHHTKAPKGLIPIPPSRPSPAHQKKTVAAATVTRRAPGSPQASYCDHIIEASFHRLMVGKKHVL